MPGDRYPFLNFFQQRMQWKCDFYLGLRQHVGETCIQAGMEANTHAPERIKLRLLSRMKPHPTDAYRQASRRIFPRLGETATIGDVLKKLIERRMLVR